MVSKQPKLVLRESAVADASRDWQPGRFIEMGAGTGHMAGLFVERGFHGTCHDLGADSREMIRRRFAGSPALQVVDDIEQLPDEAADYLYAFEVLEHIGPDREVLDRWLRKLKPGGRILVSVPAHASKYGKSDELVGHVRRYERDQLRQLLADAGVTEIRIVNYGYPVTELTRRVSNWLVRGDQSYAAMTPEQRSIRSAQAQPRAVSRVLKLISGNVVRPFCVIQRWFYRFDLGDGLVASGVKRI